jgi:hypothetical protein
VKTLGDALKEFKDHLRIVATGAGWGHVASVVPRDQSKEAQSNLATLLALLAGAIAGGTVAIIKSIREASSSQVLGIHTAKPSSNPHPPATAVNLFGYCLEARRGFPESQEEYQVISEPSLAEKEGLLFKAIQQGEQRGTELTDTYAFIDDATLFSRRFTQAVVWVITDDIGYLRAREQVYGDFMSEVMFFLPSCFEVLLWIRQTLKETGVDVVKTRFDRELIPGVLRFNVKHGLVSEQQLAEWRDKFGFALTV